MNELTDNNLDNMTREELIVEVKRLRQMTFSESERPVEYVKIIAFSIFAACVYGIAHDLVTVHVCVEYFLPPIHPIIVPTDNPFLLALVWGVIATWWVGLFLGIALAFVCRFGSKPKLTVKNVVRPVLALLAILYVASMSLGVIGYIAGRMETGLLLLLYTIPYKDITPELEAPILFNILAHESAYLLGVVGGLVLMFRLWKKRKNLAHAPGSVNTQ